MAKLGQYVNIKTGKLDANASSENGKYPFFTCAVEPLKIDTYSYDCECVLVAGNGDLNVKYYEGKFDAYQRTYIIESKDKETLYVPYMYYFLDEYVETLRNLSIGGVIKYIKLGNLTDADIPITDLSTQKQIVSNLDKVTQTIDLCNAILEKLDLLVKARFVEMFGDEFPKFDVIPLKDCCAEITGGATPSMKHYEYYGGDIPFIKSGDVKEDRVSKGALTLTDTALRETSAKLLPKDTVIVVVRSAALLHEFHIAVSDNPIVINQDLKAIKPTDQFMPIYLMWAVKMKERIILGKVQTMLTSHIRMDDFLYLDIPVPPLALQQQFAAFVEQTDKSKLAVKQVLEKAETLKKALMQEYFG